MDANSIKIHQILKTDVAEEPPIEHILPEFLRFIGNRPLIGYWIAFDIKMLNKSVQRKLGISLPNDRIDVCDLYYDRKYGNAPPGTKLDLRFASILEDLSLPPLQAHDAFSDALSTAQMYVMLQDMKARGAYLKRARSKPASEAPLG